MWSKTPNRRLIHPPDSRQAHGTRAWSRRDGEEPSLKRLTIVVGGGRRENSRARFPGPNQREVASDDRGQQHGIRLQAPRPLDVAFDLDRRRGALLTSQNRLTSVDGGASRSRVSRYQTSHSASAMTAPRLHILKHR